MTKLAFSIVVLTDSELIIFTLSYLYFQNSLKDSRCFNFLSSFIDDKSEEKKLPPSSLMPKKVFQPINLSVKFLPKILRLAEQQRQRD